MSWDATLVADASVDKARASEATPAGVPAEKESILVSKTAIASWRGGLALCACLGLACGSLHSPTDTKPNPESHSGTSGDPNGPVLGGPAPSPTPTAAPGSTPAPGPGPTPDSSTPTASSCGLPTSTAGDCAKTTPQLLSSLDQAITLATKTHPEYFNFNDTKCSNCYLVLNVTGYFAEVQRQLAAQHICSLAGSDEIGIKASNAHSEQYDILLSTSHIRRGSSAYLYSCEPAEF